MSHEYDYELPANPKWLVRRDPSATPDMQWSAHWPTGITLYAATHEIVMQRISKLEREERERKERWAREGWKP